MKGMRKPPLKERIPPHQGNLTFHTKFSNKFIRSSDLLPTTTETMGNFLTKPAKWRLFNKKETEEDWATKINWICNDQQCPNPYTHARGDPCKLTMEDLFPSNTEPPASEVTKQPEEESEDWLIEWDRENRDKNN